MCAPIHQKESLKKVCLFFTTERSIASFFFFHRTVLCVLTIVATPLMYTDWMIRRYALPFTGLSGARWHTVLYSGQTSKYRRMIRCWLLTSYRTSAPAHILAWMNTVLPLDEHCPIDYVHSPSALVAGQTSS